MENQELFNKVVNILNNDILPNRFQPRKYFDEEEILQLSESIKEHGLINPIIVRKLGDKYEIVAGERRYKANILAGNDSIPAIIMDINDKESSEIAVVENVQRKDLNAIEEAISYKRILDIGYMTQEQLAQKMGKSQSAIANKIRLLKLSDDVQDALMRKEISERHARSLLKLNSQKNQNEMLKRIINERLTVRKLDEEIDKMNNNFEQNFNVLNNNVVTPIQPTPISSDNNINDLSNGEVTMPNLGSTNEQIKPNIQAQNIESVMPTAPVLNNINTTPIQENLNSVVNSVEAPKEDLPWLNDPLFAQTNNNVNSENKTNVEPQTQQVPVEPINGGITTTPIQENVTPIVNSVEAPKEDLPWLNDPLFAQTNNNVNSENKTNVEPQTQQVPVEPINGGITTTPIQENVTPIVNSVEAPKEDLPWLNDPLFAQTNNNVNSENKTNVEPQTQQVPVEPINGGITTTPIQENVTPIVNSVEAPKEDLPWLNDPLFAQTNNNVNSENKTNVEPQTQQVPVEPINGGITTTPIQENVTPIVNSVEAPKEDFPWLNDPLFADANKNQSNVPLNTSPIIDNTLNSQQDNGLNNSIMNMQNTNEQKFETVKEPIITTDYNNQYDPIMPNVNPEPKIDFRTIINLIRECSNKIEKFGYKIETEEYNLDTLYQVVFKIEKK